MSRNSTEIALAGNLRMTLEIDREREPARYLAGVYRRVGTGAARRELWIAIAMDERASLVRRPRDTRAALWIGHAKFELPLHRTDAVADFFGLKPLATEPAR